MSGRDNRHYTEVLLIEYMSILRQQTTRQSNIIQSFVETQQRSLDNARNLLQRYLERQIGITNTNISREQPTSIPSISIPSTSIPSTSIPSTSVPYVSRSSSIWDTRSQQQSPISTRPRYTNPTSNYTTSNYTTNHLRRRRPRTHIVREQTNPPRNRRRNILAQILETTLYTSPNLSPATYIDISRNVTTHLWSEISDTTDQTFDPITQEHFQPNDSVSVIDHCGHLFMEDALSTYLTQFDHRCPVCRYNISSNISHDRTNSQTPTTPSTQPIPYFDISFNFGGLFPRNTSNLTPNIGPRNLTRQNSFDISLNSTNFNFDLNNDFNSAVNELSSAMVSSLTNAMTNPDNSGNTITAEYSLFLPSSVRRNTTNTSTNTDEAGYDETITY